MDQSFKELKLEIKNDNTKDKDRKGQNGSGSLYRGSICDASTKNSVGSIPSRHQIIVLQSSSENGFGTGSQRF